MNTKHIIKNYGQVKLRLEQLSKDFNTRSCDYYFAVGDLFNQNIPNGSAKPTISGIGAVRWKQMLHSEIDRLLEETGTEFSHSRVTAIRCAARAWDKDERIYSTSFTVYERLASHKHLIRDGMTLRGAAEAVGKAIPEPTARNRNKSWDAYNRTQRLVITVNQLRGQLKALDDDDGSPLTPEEIERIGEAYAILDTYCESKGVSMYEVSGGELVAA